MATLAEGIRAGAGTFADAASILEGLLKYKPINHVFIPSIPLRAFACELYLKSLLAYAGKTVERTHKLYELYTLLDRADQVAIEKSYMAKLCVSEGDFNKTLQEISNAFVDWRYFFEGNANKINITCLQTFREALQQRVGELDVK